MGLTAPEDGDWSRGWDRVKVDEINWSRGRLPLGHMILSLLQEDRQTESDGEASSGEKAVDPPHQKPQDTDQEFNEPDFFIHSPVSQPF